MSKQPKCVTAAIKTMYARMGSKGADHALLCVEVDDFDAADDAAEWAVKWFKQGGGKTFFY